MKKRVVIALSGGVDSSAAAALLKEQGHEVIGISMQLYDQSQLEDFRFDSCCSLKEVDTARRVAQILDIPYYVLNFEKVFKEKVVDYFVSEYLNSRTPNPCVKCNEDVKFKHLIVKAKELKADYLATGHYVRKIWNEEAQEYELHTAKDSKKDQSYFLFSMDKKEIPFLLFPLGEITKKEAREVARKYGLPNADKPESMEICFIPDNNYAGFISKQLSKEKKASLKGSMLNSKGDILGQHDGTYKFTVGQRKGLGVFDKDPLYVLDVNGEKNQVTIGKRDELTQTTLVAKDVNWISLPRADEISVRIRHRHKAVHSRLTSKVSLDNTKVEVTFSEPQFAVTPGQAAVFYEQDKLLGGGWIEASRD